MAEKGRHVCAICAAPMVLAEAGVLAGKRVTSYPGFLDESTLDGATVTGNAVERDGNIVTSRGAGTAMDFALGLSLAYMKILSLAAVIMVIIWAAAKVSLALHQRKSEKIGTSESDGAE